MQSLADTHIHTRYSGFDQVSFIPYPESFIEPSAVVGLAVMKGISVVCVTDHNSIEGAFKAREEAGSIDGCEVDVVIGEEVSTLDGELIGLFLNDHVSPGASAEETIEAIHSQGGLAVAPHPYSVIFPSLGDMVFDLRLDGIEAFNASQRDGTSNAMAERAARDRGISPLGGSDAHYFRVLGKGYTRFEGGTGDELYQAIRKGKTDFGGDTATFSDFLFWSWGVSMSSTGMVWRSLWGQGYVSDPLEKEIDCLSRRNKILALVGGMIYTFTPLPVISTIAGELYLRKKVKKRPFWARQPSSPHSWQRGRPPP